jgi:osmotically inducible lipoprotein OsmB
MRVAVNPASGLPPWNFRRIKMRTHRATVLSILAVISLAACSSNPTKQEIGTVTGAVVGGIVGSSVTGGSGVGTVGGAAAGSYIGNRIGRELDRK